MAVIIVLIVFLLCMLIWVIILMRDIKRKRKIKRTNRQLLQKQEEVENRIKKIENVYGEKATLIMFQEFHVPNICELLVILEEAQIILILGEAYNFSEILNIKMGNLDYIRLKHTVRSSVPTGVLEQAAAGAYSARTIKGALRLLEDTQEPLTSTLSKGNIKIDIMTSRLEQPVIHISPSCYTVDEIIVALSILIDKNENKWASVELPNRIYNTKSQQVF